MSTGYLLDTNVISELTKGPKANPVARAWFMRAEEHLLHLSVITLGEMLKGIALAEDAGLDMRVQCHFVDHLLPERFGERILPFDEKAARVWGTILKKLRGNSEAERSLAVDAQIAATAQAAGLTICTRNVRDFKQLGIADITNPFIA